MLTILCIVVEEDQQHDIQENGHHDPQHIQAIP
jgi:hypothetical protein